MVPNCPIGNFVMWNRRFESRIILTSLTKFLSHWPFIQSIMLYKFFIFNAIYIFKQIQLWIEIMEFLISEEKNIIIWLKKFLNSKIFFIVYFKKNNKILQEVKHNEIFFFSLICKNHWDQIDSKIQIFIFPLKSYL